VDRASQLAVKFDRDGCWMVRRNRHRLQRLAEGDVEVHRSWIRGQRRGPAAGHGCACGGELACIESGFGQAAEGAHVGTVKPVLIHDLGLAAVMLLGRAGRGQHQQWNPVALGFAHGREVVGRGGAGGAQQRDRFEGHACQAEGKESRGSFVDY